MKKENYFNTTTFSTSASRNRSLTGFRKTKRIRRYPSKDYIGGENDTLSKQDTRLHTFLGFFQHQQDVISKKMIDYYGEYTENPDAEEEIRKFLKYDPSKTSKSFHNTFSKKYSDKRMKRLNVLNRTIITNGVRSKDKEQDDEQTSFLGDHKPKGLGLRRNSVSLQTLSFVRSKIHLQKKGSIVLPESTNKLIPSQSLIFQDRTNVKINEHLKQKNMEKNSKIGIHKKRSSKVRQTTKSREGNEVSFVAKLLKEAYDKETNPEKFTEEELLTDEQKGNSFLPGTTIRIRDIYTMSVKLHRIYETNINESKQHRKEFASTLRKLIKGDSELTNTFFTFRGTLTSSLHPRSLYLNLLRGKIPIFSRCRESSVVCLSSPISSPLRYYTKLVALLSSLANLSSTWLTKRVSGLLEKMTYLSSSQAPTSMNPYRGKPPARRRKLFLAKIDDFDRYSSYSKISEFEQKNGVLAQIGQEVRDLGKAWREAIETQARIGQGA